jgi:hypothetical protein
MRNLALNGAGFLSLFLKMGEAVQALFGSGSVFDLVSP